METIDLKALAYKVLHGNQQGNFTETKSFHDRKIEGEKVSTMETSRKLFDDLFYAHAEKLKKYDLTADEIKEQRPDLYSEIQQAVKAMDEAWLKEDLQGFKDAMNTVETLYFRALEEVNALNINSYRR